MFHIAEHLLLPLSRPQLVLVVAVGFDDVCDIAVNLAIGKILTVFSVLFFLFWLDILRSSPFQSNNFPPNTNNVRIEMSIFSSLKVRI